MENISEFYGNAMLGKQEKPIISEPSISFTPKEKQQEIPEGAKIKSQTKQIYVSEIDNGYIISFDTTTCCEVQEKDGEMEEKYIYNNRRIYSKEKPLDIKLSV